MADFLQDGSPMSPMELQIAQQAIDRQRQIAQYLQQSSLQSPEGQMVSGHYVAPSPTQYLAKLAAGLIGKNQQGELDQKQMDVARQYNNNLMGLAQSLIGGGQPQVNPQPTQGDVSNAALSIGAKNGSVGPTVDNAARMDAINQQLPQQQPAPQPVTNPLFRGVAPQELASFLQAPDSALGKITMVKLQTNAKAMEPTDLIKTMMAAGVDPRSPQGQQILQGNIAKTNYIAPINAREGSTILDPRTNLPIFNAPNKEGFQYTFDGNGNASARQIPGAAEAIGATEEAKAGAKANYQVQAGVDANGNPIFTTAGAIARGPASGNASQQNAEPFKGANLLAQLPPNVRAGILESAKADPSGKFSLNYQLPNGQRIVGDIDLNSPDGTPKNSTSSAVNVGAVRPAPVPGYVKGQEDLQGDLTQKWKPLNELNSQAQVTSSYLQNIKGLANKAAVGPMSDKIDYVNGLLTVAGISDRAKDAVTANDLLDKYSNQIVSRLGTGGLGTDAARAILQSAYPNAHMTKEAINEAADNLIGANEMVKAKAKLLQPSYMARDPQAYSQKELIFDQNADPRIWQYKNLVPGSPQAKAFASSVMKQDPEFVQKIKALEGIGAL